MQNHLLPLNNLPAEGREIVLNDAAIWSENLGQFHMDCRVVAPLSVNLHIMPLEEGYLVRGQLKGSVVVPCNRCAEDVTVVLDTAFEEFEEVPEDEDSQDAQPGDSHVVLEKGGVFLNLAALCWEEFVLALPMNPLCSPDCQGLCPQCGANLNRERCTCVRDEGDPRLAVLRGLSVKKS